MPPVRWKYFYTTVAALLVLQFSEQIMAVHIPESYSIIGDGWTPILGQNHNKHGFGELGSNNGEITQYRNPASKTSETVKAEKPQPPPPVHPSAPAAPSGQGNAHPNSVTNTVPKKYTEVVTPSPKKLATLGGGSISHLANTISTGGGVSMVGKIPPHSKPMILLPMGQHHGPHIPLSPQQQMNLHHRPPLKHGGSPPPPPPPPPLPPMPNKHHHHHHHHTHGPPPPPNVVHGKRHHKPMPPPPPGPVRYQIGSHSTRDEVYVPAPSQIGTFTYYSPPGSNGLKTRINQPHAHIEFTSHFGLPSPGSEQSLFSLSRAPVQQYLVPKHPVLNDVHYPYTGEGFTGNLVPPPNPFKYVHEAEKHLSTKPQSRPPPPPKGPTTEAYIQEKPKIKHDNSIPVHSSFSSFASTKPEKTVDVQVTKEKLKVYHNGVPSAFDLPSRQPDFDFNYQPVKHSSEAPLKHATYEVTEGKLWHETQPFYQAFTTRAPHKSRRPTYSAPSAPPASNANLIEDKPFLPTPFKPEFLQPTIATQSEVSTIYNQLSTRIKQHNTVPNNHPTFFSVKEVSTHFPIVGRPDERPDYFTQAPTISTTDPPQLETTTFKFKQYEFGIDEELGTTLPPTTRSPVYPSRGPPQRKRPNQRRRRPGTRTRTSTTEEAEPVTDSYEVQKLQESESEESASSTSTERSRNRRPSRFRTTETPPRPSIEEEDVKMAVIRSRNRHRTSRPTTTTSTSEDITIYEMPSNYKSVVEEEEHHSQEIQEQERFVTKSTMEKDFPESFEDQFKANVFRTENYDLVYDEPTKDVVKKPEVQNIFFPKPTDLSDVTIYDTTKPHTISRVTEPTRSAELDHSPFRESNIMKVEEVQIPERIATTVFSHLPDNEIDYTTMPQNSPEVTTIQEIYREDYRVPTTTMTPTTTSTTSAPTTTSVRPSRVRGRPGGNRFDSSRPRFSVKDYRQRTGSSSTTTTEAPRDAPTRIRFPNRSRRPLTSSTTTTQRSEETTTERAKFTPKEPRASANSNSAENESFAEKHFRGVTRKPFGRYRPTTEASSTPRISIKSNIFSNMKRPTPISLRNRILNRNRNVTSTTTTTASADESPSIASISSTAGSTIATEVPALDDVDESEEINETDVSEMVDSTVPYSKSDTGTTEFGAKKMVDVLTQKDEPDADILKNESFMYSQRVSDLTSSSKNDYNTPGRFKNVPQSSRRVPSYFTLSTDEPILPIQAFFPNINKDKA